MGKTEKELKRIIKKRKNSNPDNEKLFEESMMAFKDLLDRGLASPRGYNLETIENRGSRIIAFNANM